MLACGIVLFGCSADDAGKSGTQPGQTTDVGINFGGDSFWGGGAEDSGAARAVDTFMVDTVTADTLGSADVADDTAADDTADGAVLDVMGGGFDAGVPDTGGADSGAPGLDTSSDAGSPSDTCACDDGDACTKDTCDKGTCLHVIAVDCSPMDGPCIAGVCKGGTCVAAAKSDGGACDDGDPCSVQDACLGGQCSGKEKDCSAAGGACTTGVCDSGACVSKVKPSGSACSDGEPCTVADGCYGGKCSGTPLDCSGKAGVCLLAACKAGACVTTPVKVGTACQDGNGCTTGDACTSKGTCEGKVKNCSAKNSVCAVGTCSNGACYAKAKPNGTACSDGDACTLSDACKAGACVGQTKSDSYEPNNSSPKKSLGTKGDCDPASTFKANISSKSDVDWYSFETQDKTFCTLQPEVKLTGLSSNLQLCIFFKCSNGKVGSGTVGCAAGQQSGGGPSGSFGCCSSKSGNSNEFAKLKPQCSTFAAGDDSGTVFVRVTPASGASCSNYTATWSAAK